MIDPSGASGRFHEQSRVHELGGGHLCTRLQPRVGVIGSTRDACELCVYIYIYTFLYIHICICVSLYIYGFVCIYISVYMHVYVYVIEGLLGIVLLQW